MRRVYNGSGGVAITFHVSAEPLRTNVQDDLIVASIVPTFPSRCFWPELCISFTTIGGIDGHAPHVTAYFAF